MIQMEKTNKQTWEMDHKIMFHVVITYLSSIYTLFIQNRRILEMLSFRVEYHDCHQWYQNKK